MGYPQGGQISCTPVSTTIKPANWMTYKHLSSTTLMTGRIPFPPSFGVGTPASEPSPRNVTPSSHFVLSIVSFVDLQTRYYGLHLCRFSNGERPNTNYEVLASFTFIKKYLTDQLLKLTMLLDLVTPFCQYSREVVPSRKNSRYKTRYTDRGNQTDTEMQQR